MKKQVQLAGERDWFGDDILTAQDEIWKVLEQWLGQYDQPCIVSGCLVTPNGGNYDVSPGIMLLKDIDGNYQFCEFAGATNISLPRYAYVNKATTNALYYDTNTKAKAYTYTALMQTGLPSEGYYLQFLSANTPTWKDIIQDSKHRMVTDTQITAWTDNIAVVAGMIMIWPAAVVPAGWLECNGSPVSRTTYANLFDAIGTLYGGGDGSTTFELPDLRGEFVRGFDNGRGVDAGRTLGSDQTDQVKEFDVVIPQGNSYTGAGGTTVGRGADSPNNITITIGDGNVETRPRNVAMKYIIKT